MIKYLQLPFYFDAVQMQQELQQLTGNQWQLHYQKKHYDGEWSAIPLRSSNGAADNVLIDVTNDAVYTNTSLLLQSPYLTEVLQTFKCNLQAVRLLKLGAGAVIKEHRDAELYFEKGFFRIHIPVLTNDAVEFCLDGEQLQLKEGECWYMNFNLPHSLQNKGITDRVHLVIDGEVNDWVKKLFNHSDVLNKKEISEHALYGNEEKQKIIDALRMMNTAVGNKLADEMENSKD
jgi:mannose-6-phosphate isomerase-like protein (cupin superfamily)